MTRRSFWLLLLSSPALGAAGCDRSLQDPCDGNACPSQRSVTNVFQTSINRQVDLLFVIDNTSAMAPYVADLAAGYAASARILDNFPRGLPSLHVGFIAASSCGALTARSSACGLAPPAPYLKAQSCGRDVNFSGPIDSTFACLADLGTAGCAPGQPMAALRRVFQAPPPGWEDFLRPTAYLEIVIVSADDDASGTAVSETVDLLRGLKEDPASTIAVAAIGPGECAADASAAPPAPRLRELARSFGANGLVAPLCAQSVESALAFLNGYTLDVGLMCLQGVADTDSATPGLQPNCTVEDTVTRPDGSETTLLPRCDEAPPPCWRAGATNPFSCGAVFDIDRGPDFCPQWSTYTRIECLGCLDPNDPACAAR
jgi:hypothetical protein